MNDETRPGDEPTDVPLPDEDEDTPQTATGQDGAATADTPEPDAGYPPGSGVVDTPDTPDADTPAVPVEPDDRLDPDLPDVSDAPTENPYTTDGPVKDLP